MAFSSPMGKIIKRGEEGNKAVSSPAEVTGSSRRCSMEISNSYQQ